MKKIGALVLALSLVINFGVDTAYAKSNEVTTYNYIVDNPQEIPEGIKPLYFDTEEESNEYFRDFKFTINKTNNSKSIENLDTCTDSLVTMASYSYLAYVDDVSGPVDLSLYCSYTTSGPHSGYIMSHSAGITYSYIIEDYPEAYVYSNCTSNVTSTGKDIYCTADATVTYYYYVGKLLHAQSYYVELSGYAYAIR